MMKRKNPDKYKSKMKWLILMLASAAVLGDYYCFDNPGALHSMLHKRFHEEIGDNFEYFYQLLYSVYSLPNVILPLISGLLILKLGYRSMFFLLGLLVLIGQFFFAFGCSIQSSIMMLIGRIIFGVGGESLNTAQFMVIVNWFPANQLGFALGCCLSFARLGNVLNDVISPRVATTGDVSSAMWLGFAICSFSLMCIIILLYIDWRQDILIKMREIISNSSAVHQKKRDDSSDSLYALTKLSKKFYILALFCMCMYGGIIPFNFIATNFLIKTWYNNQITTEIQHEVGMAMALPYFVSTILIPIFGILVDIYGRRGYLLILSSLLGIITYMLFLVINPLIPLFLLGITYSIFASVFWPCLSLIVPREILGIANGFCTSGFNLGFVIFPMIIAYVYTKTQSYELTLLFFICILSFALILAVYVQIKDMQEEGVLNRIPNEQEKEKEKEKSSTKLCTDPSDHEKQTEESKSEKADEEAKLMTVKDLL